MTTPSPNPTPFNPYPGIPSAKPVTRGPTRPATGGARNKGKFSWNPETKTITVRPDIKIDGNGDGDNNNNTNKKDLVKVSDLSNYIENYNQSLSEFDLESRASFFSFTGNEILQVARNYDVSSDSLSLNRNILDIVDVVGSFGPKEIIKMQDFDGGYFAQFATRLQNDTYSIDKVTGIVTVEIPKSLVSENNFVEIQTLTPGSVKNDTIYE
jgi:hypothetical protein